MKAPWILALCLPLLSSFDRGAETYRIFLLKRQADRFVVEAVEVQTDGRETRTFECNPETGIVDVLLTVGPGGSAAIATGQSGREITVVFEDGEVTVSEGSPNGGGWTRPTRSLEQLARYDVRVSVTGGDGLAQAFLITQNETVASDLVGPVVDLFAGKVPLGEGDCALFTETYAHHRGAPVSGEAPLWIDRWPLVEVALEDGRTGVFLVDIGAGGTVVSDEFLPQGQVIEKSEVTSYSAAGVKKLKYTPEGATGAVQTVLGATILPRLSLGGLVFDDVHVDVMSGMGEIFTRQIDGILGLDLIARTRVLSLVLGGEQPSMRMSTQAPDTTGEFVELPFTLIRSHLVVDALVGQTKVSFILDTGAPAPFLDAAAAVAAGVEWDGAPGKEARGIDGGSVDVRDSQPATLTLGARELEQVLFKVSALPVFSSLRCGGQSVGLLGVEIFARFERVDIDFEERVVRFFL